MKRVSLISVVLIVLFSTYMAPANTLFTEAEWAILENWNHDSSNKSVGKPEAYSAPEGTEPSEVEIFNTLFSSDDWMILKNWNNRKTRVNVGPAEGYSEPEGVKPAEYKQFNTCFSKEEWQILENWSHD